MRWVAKCAYDGTDFDGWQSQVSGNTIQDFIERRLGVIFAREVRIHSSGRTDAGVHALGQVFHFDAEWPHGAATLLRALQVGFPKSIHIYEVQLTDDTFHARFSARGKTYFYKICTGRASPFETRYCLSLGNMTLNEAHMRQAATSLLGKHFFKPFCADRGDGKPLDYVRHLRTLDLTVSEKALYGDANQKEYIFRLSADGFLYKMVRSIVGTLIEVGRGKFSATDVEQILRSGERTQTVVTAPPHGLCLEKVDY